MQKQLKSAKKRPKSSLFVAFLYTLYNIHSVLVYVFVCISQCIYVQGKELGLLKKILTTQFVVCLDDSYKLH